MYAWLASSLIGAALAAPVTDPNDPRDWQGASVETFRQLLGLATTQDVIDLDLLDDGAFPTYADTSLFDAAPTDPCPAFAMSINTALYGGQIQGTSGTSYEPLGYGYTTYADDLMTYRRRGSCLDWHWIQDGSTNVPADDILSGNVWDLGGLSNQVAVFPIIDHGPIPGEAIEYTVYLSNDPTSTVIGTNGNTDWVEAELVHVYLEGWHTGWVADGFTTVWKLPGNQLFRYVNVIASGPGAIVQDGDDEIDAVMGLTIGGDPVCRGRGDTDGDGVCDDTDNCPRDLNPLQDDRDHDGTGDVCDTDPYLEIAGGCGGNVIFNAGNFTPSGDVTVLTSATPGTTVIPVGACAGHTLDLAMPIRVRAQFQVGASGDFLRVIPLSGAICGQWVQIVDMATCRTTNAAMIP
ncbi:MAG TPA: hypothetical protein PKA64_07850 [Myxococcota bacterium]|nr:hypothetical protein [Myxococcota bacterium]